MVNNPRSTLSTGRNDDVKNPWEYDSYYMSITDDDSYLASSALTNIRQGAVGVSNPTGTPLVKIRY